MVLCSREQKCHDSVAALDTLSEVSWEVPVLGTGTGHRFSLHELALTLLIPTAGTWAGSAPTREGFQQKHATEMLVHTVTDRQTDRLHKLTQEGLDAGTQTIRCPGAWPPPSSLMMGTGLSWLSPGSYKGQDTTCTSFSKDVFGLFQLKKGEEGNMRLLVTAQNTPGVCEVFFSYAHLCFLLLLLLFPHYFLTGPHVSSAS